MEKEKKRITKEIEKINQERTFKVVLLEMIPYVVIILSVVLIRTFLVTPIKVNGTSMTDTLQHGDTMLLNKIGMKFKDIERYQIVVIKTDESYLIKRVVGLPGETVEYKDGKLLIDGKEVKDPYFKDDNTLDFSKVVIPKGHYYVLGDNRKDSIDSRIIGCVSEEDIMGTTSLVIFPISDMGIVD